jgi:hypothetical protein
VQLPQRDALGPEPPAALPRGLDQRVGGQPPGVGGELGRDVKGLLKRSGKDRAKEGSKGDL